MAVTTTDRDGDWQTEEDGCGGINMREGERVGATALRLAIMSQYLLEFFESTGSQSTRVDNFTTPIDLSRLTRV